MTHKKTPSHSFIRTTWCCFYPLFCYLCSGLSFHCLVSFIERTNNRSTAHFSKLHSCFNFRSHASGGKLSLFYILLHLIQRYICQCFLIRLSVIDKYVFYICYNHKYVCFSFFIMLDTTTLLVDDCVYAFNFPVLIFYIGNTAVTCNNNNGIGIRQ